MGTPLHIVALAEARELLSVLRRNRRFGYFLAFTAASQPSEHPFVKEIKLLRDIILENNKASSSARNDFIPEYLIPESSLRLVLEPFLHVITSRDASGLITGVALQSIDRIISSLFHLISRKVDETLWKEYVPTLNIVVDSVAACRFDVTDPAADEVVLSRITTVISRVATSPAAPFLSDAAMLRGIEACLGVASGRRRASELLRRSAEHSLCNIVNSIGNCSKQIASTCTEKVGTDAIVKTLSFESATSNANGVAYNLAFSTEGFDETGPLSGTVVAAVILVACRMAESPSSSSSEERVLGLQMLSGLLTFGSQDLMQIPPVRDVLLRDCSHVLLQCVGAFKSPLAVIAASFTTTRLLVHALGAEGMAFLSALIENVYPCYVSGVENIKAATILENNKATAQGNTSNGASQGGNSNSKATSGALPTEITDGIAVEINPVVREVGLESLADLLAAPGLLSSLYAVVDCDLKSEDVVGPLLVTLGQASMSARPRRRSRRLRASSSGSARMAGALSSGDSDDEESGLITGGSSDSQRFSRSAALLCAETVLAIVRTIGERLDEHSEVPSPSVSTEKQRTMRKQKVRCQKMAMAFNSQSRINRGERLIAFLSEYNRSSSTTQVDNVQDELDNDIADCVKFLRETKGLDKEMIGVILGEPDDISRRILASFTATFNFRRRLFRDCIRLYLECFRLPKEGQKIERIIECFSQSFYAQNMSMDETETDEKSEHNVVGLFKNADAVFTLTYSTIMLNTDLHNGNVKRKMSLEQFIGNNKGMNGNEDFPRWLLERIYNSIAASEIKIFGESGVEAMTSAHWEASIEDMCARNRLLLDPRSAMNFDEDIFVQCWQSAIAAATVMLSEAGDANQAQKALEGFVSVARCATAFRHSGPVDVVVASLVNATNIREGPLFGAVYRFGTDIKAQMAAVVLTDVVRQCGDFLRNDGWQALVSYVLRLHALNMLPDELEKSIGGNGTDLNVHGEPLPRSLLIPSWWPSQTNKKTDKANDDDEKSKKPARPKGLLAALFAASIGSDASSDEEMDYDEGGNSEWTGVKSHKVSNTPPSYLKIRSNEQMEAQKLARECISRCRVEDILVDEVKVLRSDALLCLTKSIARAAGRILDASGAYPSTALNEQDVEAIGGTIKSGIPVQSVESIQDPMYLNIMDFAPSSPPDDSSAIVGVAAGMRGDSSSVEIDSEYLGYSGNGSWSGVARDRDEKKAREFVVAFCIDLLCNLTLQNRDRLHIPWPALHSVLVRIIAPATKSSALLERSIIGLLRVATRLLHRDELHNDVLRTLNLIVRLPNEVTSALSSPISAGLYNVVKSHGVHIVSTSGWHAIFSIIESMPSAVPVAVDTSLKVLSFILTEESSLNALRSKTFAPILDAIMAYVTDGSVNASLQALELLYLLSRRIPELEKEDIEEETSENHAPLNNRVSSEDGVLWAEFWGPLLKGFATGARDPRGKVRNEALTVLEKVIAVCGTDALSAKQWKVALSTVLFPLMKQLFSTQGFLEATVEAERTAQRRLRIVQSGSGNGKNRRVLSSVQDEQLLKSVSAACRKSRLQAFHLTSKTFLQHHSFIAAGLPPKEFTELWLGVLEVYRVAVLGGDEEVEVLTSTEPDELREHVPESVKNLMLVMSDSGLLTETEPERWDPTFESIRTFLPDTVADVESLFEALTKSSSSKQQQVPAANS